MFALVAYTILFEEIRADTQVCPYKNLHSAGPSNCCFVTMRFIGITMESFNTKPEDSPKPTRYARTIVVGRVENIPSGRCATVDLADGNELALYNVDGEFYATENSCPHRGAPLAQGLLCGHLIECDWHGWQFDVRNGRCLTVSESVRTYRVLIEDGWVKIEVEPDS